MPAVVVAVLVEVGRKVARGDPLVVLSAMKTETQLASPIAGRVKVVSAVVGAKVRPGDVLVEVEGGSTPVTAGLRGQRLRIPIAHAEGNYFADPDTLDQLEADGRVVFRYVGGAPNGAARDIAGIAGGPRMNVVGLMPHPERASEAILGNADGRKLFDSLLRTA